MSRARLDESCPSYLTEPSNQRREGEKQQRRSIHRASSLKGHRYRRPRWKRETQAHNAPTPPPFSPASGSVTPQGWRCRITSDESQPLIDARPGARPSTLSLRSDTEDIEQAHASCSLLG
ncbi:hypothetical protein AAFF_G00221770 [Aldrovandia affinis]|uniref:Uncharacterized protein n=1 Tax=Aldrovandia affinis TaxID=143900 RepID=A0AAD7RG60_9TELE|nr:hypothetical protein AAFF_G00221770 [Aldrovandia affinis]